MQGTTLSLPSTHSLPTRPSRCRTVPVYAAIADVAPSSRSVVSGRRSLYEVLKVRRNASQVEIKAAYRTLAKLYHPDAISRFVDSPSEAAPEARDFIEIHNAYTTLSDTDARATYDLNLDVNSQRRWSAAGLSAYRSSGRGTFYPTRRWETDQCW